MDNVYILVTSTTSIVGWIQLSPQADTRNSDGDNECLSESPPCHLSFTVRIPSQKTYISTICTKCQKELLFSVPCMVKVSNKPVMSGLSLPWFTFTGALYILSSSLFFLNPNLLQSHFFTIIPLLIFIYLFVIQEPATIAVKISGASEFVFMCYHIYIRVIVFIISFFTLMYSYSKEIKELLFNS